ncbi:MAG: winged helix-turn-helix transcriptional regulator [Gemmatimonadaceae bacterium]|nr:winged helix-turn-helix transcriptional regulator [Gemmatimonadaceae bacterium]
MTTTKPQPLRRERSQSTERALKLWVVLARAFAAVEARARTDAARRGLTLAELGVLEALQHKGPLLLGELQAKLLVSSGGITYLVDRLQGRGLVRRRRSPDDRRACYVELTRAGARLIAAEFPGHARCIEQTMSGLGPREQREAIQLLRTLGLAAAEMEPCTAPEP